MNVFTVIIFFLLQTFCLGEHLAFLKDGSHKSSYLIFDGEEFKDLTLKIKFSTDKKSGRKVTEMILVVGKKEMKVPAHLFQKIEKVSFDSIVVGKQTEDAGYDYFVRVTNNLESSVENLIFEFKNGSFLKISKYNSKGLNK